MKTSQYELDPFQFFTSCFIVILNKVFDTVEKDIYAMFVTHTMLSIDIHVHLLVIYFN